VITIATDQGTIECTTNRAADHGVGVEGVVLLGEPPMRGRPPHRQVLDILTRAAYLLGWHRHFGPASGLNPKTVPRRLMLIEMGSAARVAPAQ
jgi:hypothetical protein